MEEFNVEMDCVARTHFPLHEYNFKWILQKYSKLFNETSPQFYPEIGNPWFLRFSRCSTKINLLIFRSGGHGQVEVQCKFCASGRNGKVWKNSSVCLNFENFSMSLYLIKNMELDPENVIKESNDVVEFTLLLKISKMDAKKQDTSVLYNFPSKEEFMKDVHKSMAEDLQKFYENNLNPDVSLSIDGEILDVHKAIISARSSVFANMFQQEMVESTNNVVVIEDVKMSTMKEVVAFIYGKIKRDYDYDTTVEVYYVADKYNVKKLKEVCGAILASQINETNAGQVLNLADLHHDDVLKNRAMRFIIANMKSCVETEWWRNLITNKNKLAADLAAYSAGFI